MTKRCSTLIAIAVFTLTSCATKKQIFIGEIFSKFENLNLNSVEIFERKNKSEDITPKHLIGIGEGIYPNKNQYKLETPRIFQRQVKPNFKFTSEYFYQLSDSSIKVVLYQWDDMPSKKYHKNKVDRDNSKRYIRFQSKFNQLQDSLTRVLGTPTLMNLEQTKVPLDETFRDSIKWQSVNGLNAYLFMFGNNRNGFRQIRLAFYRD